MLIILRGVQSRLYIPYSFPGFRLLSAAMLAKLSYSLGSQHSLHLAHFEIYEGYMAEAASVKPAVRNVHS